MTKNGETVDTPISECKAKNPLKCKYHGLQAFHNLMVAATKNLGLTLKNPQSEKYKGNKGFAFHLSDFDMEKVKDVKDFENKMNNVLNPLGYSIHGEPNGFFGDWSFEAVQIKKGMNKSGKKAKEESNTDNGKLDAVDSLSSDTPPSDKNGDNGDLTSDDIDPFFLDADESLLDKETEELLMDADESLLDDDSSSEDGDKLPPPPSEIQIDDFFLNEEEDKTDKIWKVKDTILSVLGGFSANGGFVDEVKDELNPDGTNPLQCGISKVNGIDGKTKEVVAALNENLKPMGYGAIPIFSLYDSLFIDIVDTQKDGQGKKLWLSHHPEDADDLDTTTTQPGSTEVKKGDQDTSVNTETDKPNSTNGVGTEWEFKHQPPRPLLSEKLEPIEHDDSKFPQDLTKEALDEAINDGADAGGHGDLDTRIITIGGRKYICKHGGGYRAGIVKNGYNADMAYRAGGIYAPDAKLYDFGDGSVYKLSEFIEGKSLYSVWKEASEERREEIRKELLKGYPLDVLFSNYDVLGTSPEVAGNQPPVYVKDADGNTIKTRVAFDNVIIGNDGNVYRIDNDGSFALTGKGGKKSSTGGSLTCKVEFEKWDDWQDRQWIDDFRTMRRNERNLGIFDHYSTADIFFSAGSIDFDKACENLPLKVRLALKKPLFEMKQMTYRAVNIALGEYKNNKFASMALDASYDASKIGLRDLCKRHINWHDSGFGIYREENRKYQPKPFTEKPPEKPIDPRTELGEKLQNESYTGNWIVLGLIKAAKTINHHCSNDFNPNQEKLSLFNMIDRDKLAELAKTDENADKLLGFYDDILASKKSGWKKKIGMIQDSLTIKAELPDGFRSPSEIKLLDGMKDAIDEYKIKEKEYTKKLSEYRKREMAHNLEEAKKSYESGSVPYHNFHHFANSFIKEGRDTNGVINKVMTNGVTPIEESMSAQKDGGYEEKAVNWRVREMIGLGYSRNQIEKLISDGKIYNGGFYRDAIVNYMMGNPSLFESDMNSQAMYLGLNMLKMENETNEYYDKGSGVVFVSRTLTSAPYGLSDSERDLCNSDTKKGFVKSSLSSPADCTQFEKNDYGGEIKQVYALPFSRVVCASNNERWHKGLKKYAYLDEQEYVGNLWKLPFFVYHAVNFLSWPKAVSEAKDDKGMSNILKMYSDRLSSYNTLTKDGLIM